MSRQCRWIAHFSFFHSRLAFFYVQCASVFLLFWTYDFLLRMPCTCSKIYKCWKNWKGHWNWNYDTLVKNCILHTLHVPFDFWSAITVLEVSGVQIYIQKWKVLDFCKFQNSSLLGENQKSMIKCLKSLKCRNHMNEISKVQNKKLRVPDLGSSLVWTLQFSVDKCV